MEDVNSTDELLIDAPYNNLIRRITSIFSTGFNVVTPHNSVVQCVR